MGLPAVGLPGVDQSAIDPVDLPTVGLIDRPAMDLSLVSLIDLTAAWE